MSKKTQAYVTRNGKELFVRLTGKKARLIYERICLNCSRDFISNRSTSLYCCDDCRVKLWKKNKKERERRLWIEETKKRLLNKG